MTPTEKSDMAHWFPRLKKVNGISLPETTIIQNPCSEKEMAKLINIVDGEEPELFNSLVQNIKYAAQEIGFPVFLRTGHLSGKHNWENTCYVKDPKSIPQHVYNIIEMSFMASVVGLPTDTWVVRKMLRTEPLFTVKRWGNFPVTKERRYFIDQGEVIQRQPYWPEDAIEPFMENDEEYWKEKLERSNRSDYAEVELLTQLSEKVCEEFKDYWSLDFLWAENKWWIIDMAAGELSYGHKKH